MLAGELGSAFFRSCADPGGCRSVISPASAWTSPPVKKAPVPELCQLSSVYECHRECGNGAVESAGPPLRSTSDERRHVVLWAYATATSAFPGERLQFRLGDADGVPTGAVTVADAVS